MGYAFRKYTTLVKKFKIITLNYFLEISNSSKIVLMRAVGFEPTQISLTELKTVALNWGYYIFLGILS